MILTVLLGVYLACCQPRVVCRPIMSNGGSPGISREDSDILYHVLGKSDTDKFFQKPHKARLHDLKYIQKGILSDPKDIPRMGPHSASASHDELLLAISNYLKESESRRDRDNLRRELAYGGDRRRQVGYRGGKAAKRQAGYTGENIAKRETNLWSSMSVEEERMSNDAPGPKDEFRKISVEYEDERRRKPPAGNHRPVIPSVLFSPQAKGMFPPARPIVPQARPIYPPPDLFMAPSRPNVVVSEQRPITSAESAWDSDVGYWDDGPGYEPGYKSPKSKNTLVVKKLKDGYNKAAHYEKKPQFMDDDMYQMESTYRIEPQPLLEDENWENGKMMVNKHKNMDNAYKLGPEYPDLTVIDDPSMQDNEELPPMHSQEPSADLGVDEISGFVEYDRKQYPQKDGGTKVVEKMVGRKIKPVIEPNPLLEYRRKFSENSGKEQEIPSMSSAWIKQVPDLRPEDHLMPDYDMNGQQTGYEQMEDYQYKRDVQPKNFEKEFEKMFQAEADYQNEEGSPHYDKTNKWSGRDNERPGHVEMVDPDTKAQFVDALNSIEDAFIAESNKPVMMQGLLKSMDNRNSEYEYYGDNDIIETERDKREKIGVEALGISHKYPNSTAGAGDQPPTGKPHKKSKIDGLVNPDDLPLIHKWNIKLWRKRKFVYTVMVLTWAAALIFCCLLALAIKCCGECCKVLWNRMCMCLDRLRGRDPNYRIFAENMERIGLDAPDYAMYCQYRDAMGLPDFGKMS